MKHNIDLILKSLNSGHSFHSNFLVPLFESKFQSFVNQKYISLVEQIHRQELELHFHQHLKAWNNKIKTSEALIPYFSITYDFGWQFTDDAIKLIIETFKKEMKNQNLLSNLISEYSIKLSSTMKKNAKQCLDKWTLHVNEIKEKEAEKQRKIQAVNLREKEMELKKLQILKAQEENRLYALHWQQHERHMLHCKRHFELMEKIHFDPPKPLGNELVSCQTWGNGSKTFYTWVNSQGHLFLHSVSE
jgi:hypothetical protein